jgi:hypothetical protein
VVTPSEPIGPSGSAEAGGRLSARSGHWPSGRWVRCQCPATAFQ